MAKRRSKSRVLLTTSQFRVLIDELGFAHLEVHDGYDWMNQRRWRDPHEERVNALTQDLVRDIAQALQRRAQRRKKRRG